MHQTATDIASAIRGRPRQDVFVCSATTRFGAYGPMYVVLVGGEYYQVGKYTLDALRDGWAPEELELEPYEGDEENGVV